MTLVTVYEVTATATTELFTKECATPGEAAAFAAAIEGERYLAAVVGE